MSELPFELKLEVVARAGKPFFSTLLLACAVKAPPATSEVNAAEIKTVVRMSSRLVALALLHSLPSREDAVRRAARCCQLDVVLILLDGEAVEGERIKLEGLAFVTAASTGHGQFRRVLPLIERIWQHRHNHARTVLKGALILAAFEGHDDVVRTLLGLPARGGVSIAPRADDGVLYMAVDAGHAAVVRTLLEWPVHPASADWASGAALKLAVRAGHADVVRVLLDAHASKNAKWSDALLRVARRDATRGVALTIAVRSGIPGVVAAMLEEHADADVREEWREAALRIEQDATVAGHVAILRMLPM